MPFASGQRRRSRWSSGASTVTPTSGEKYDTGAVTRQIDNAKLRLADAGVNVETDTDKRNWFEKATNLPEGQNFFFDALELLSRPSQAILNVIDKVPDGDRSVADAAWRGFSGRERVRGADIIEKRGIDDPFTKFALGTGLDIALDPVSYIPGGQIAKGTGFATRAAAKGISRGYRAAERIPIVGRFSERVLRPAAQKVKDTAGYAFNRDYKLDETLDGGVDDTVKRLARETDNARQYLQEQSLATVADTARRAGGVDTGADVGRRMERDLDQSLRSDRLLSDIMSGKRLSFNEASGELQDFVTNINKKVLNSPVVKRQIERKQKQIDGLKKRVEQHKATLLELESGDWLATRQQAVTDRLAKAMQGKGPRAQASLQRKADERLLKLEDQARVLDRKLKSDIARYEDEIMPKLLGQVDRIQRGIVFNPREGGKAFDLVNENASLYRRALGDQVKFIEEISRRGKFDDLVKPELKEALRPIVTGLLVEGEKTVAGLRGTPEQKELRRLFGRNLQFAYDKKGNVRMKLVQRDPDKLYYAMKNASPVIPEDLTDFRNIKDPSGLEMGDIRFMDRLDNVNIPRPVREQSRDVEINFAAQDLMDSNQFIRDYARDNGIEIPELEGYMKHVLSKAEREARSRGRSAAIDQGARGQGNPKKSILNSRELHGSVEDINERVERPFFEPNAFFATAIGQKQLIDYVQAVQFRRKVLSNPNFAQRYERGMEIGPNHAVIDTNNYKFIKAGDEAPGAPLADEIGGEYLVTKAVKNALDRYQRLTTDEGTKGMLKALDATTNMWKKFALFSPLYHVRNLAGAMFNNYVGGMNTPNLIKYTKEGLQEVAAAARGKESELFNEYRRQGLNSQAMSNVEFLRSTDPEKQVEKMVADRSKSFGGRLRDRLNPVNAFETSREAGDFIDQVNRFALYKWARDKGATAEQAAAKVREVQFDYTNLAPFEQNVLTRLIPFYRWMRNNIPFQIQQFINDPRKYANVNKARLNAQEAVGLDEETMPDYMKESFAVPVYGSEATGTGKTLGLNLPLADLTKLNDPLKVIIDALSAPLKVPLELGVNRSFFRNKPIQNFEGEQTQFQLPGGVDFGLDPKLAYVLENLTGQIGRGLSGYLKAPESEDQDAKFRTPSLGIKSLLRPYDVQANEYYTMLDELRKLQDYIRYIEQQTGQEVRTVNQIR